MITILKAADRRKVRPKINIALFGPSGVGKTTQARTLDPEGTLFIDIEGGTLSIEDWDGDTLNVIRSGAQFKIHPWEIIRDLAILFGGPDPAAVPGTPYHESYFEKLRDILFKDIDVSSYHTLFVDSITVASRQCLNWCQQQPEAWSEKKNAPDMLGTYGLLGREFVKWLTHLQHAPLSVIAVGILNDGKDEFGRQEFSIQMEGKQSMDKLPGIWDLVATLEYARGADGKPVIGEDGKKKRAIYPTGNNPYGFPGKDRSGRLLDIEPPDLAAMIHKIQTGSRLDANLTTTLP